MFDFEYTVHANEVAFLFTKGKYNKMLTSGTYKLNKFFDVIGEVVRLDELRGTKIGYSYLSDRDVEHYSDDMVCIVFNLTYVAEDAELLFLTFGKGLTDKTTQTMLALVQKKCKEEYTMPFIKAQIGRDFELYGDEIAMLNAFAEHGGAKITSVKYRIYVNEDDAYNYANPNSGDWENFEQTKKEKKAADLMNNEYKRRKYLRQGK